MGEIVFPLKRGHFSYKVTFSCIVWNHVEIKLFDFFAEWIIGDVFDILERFWNRCWSADLFNGHIQGKLLHHSIYKYSWWMLFLFCYQGNKYMSFW